MPTNLHDTVSEWSRWLSCYITCCVGGQTPWPVIKKNVSLEIDDDYITPSNIDGLVQNCSNSIANAQEI